jgi:hypothetical protein
LVASRCSEKGDIKSERKAKSKRLNSVHLVAEEADVWKALHLDATAASGLPKTNTNNAEVYSRSRERR